LVGDRNLRLVGAIRLVRRFRLVGNRDFRLVGDRDVRMVRSQRGYLDVGLVGGQRLVRNRNFGMVRDLRLVGDVRLVGHERLVRDLRMVGLCRQPAQRHHQRRLQCRPKRHKFRGGRKPCLYS
jgi:hypothetical protein